MLASGWMDQIVSPDELKEAVFNLTFGENATHVDIEEGVVYGNISAGTARKLVFGNSDHAFEAIDNVLVQESIAWLKDTLHPPTTSETCSIPLVGGVEFLSLLCGLLFYAVLITVLSFPKDSDTPACHSIDTEQKSQSCTSKCCNPQTSVRFSFLFIA